MLWIWWNISFCRPKMLLKSFGVAFLFIPFIFSRAHLNERIFVRQECQNQWVSPSSQKFCHKSSAATLVLGGKFHFPYLIVTD